MSKPKEKSKLFDTIGPFTTIPNSVVKMTKTIGTDALALWVYLRYRTNGESGVAFPSYTTIQKDTGLSRNKVAKCLTILEENGILYRERRFANSNTYELQMPPVVPQQDYSSPTAGLQSSQSGTTVVPQQDTNKTDITKTEIEQEEQPRKKRAARTYSEIAKQIAKDYYALLSERERSQVKYNQLLEIGQKEKVGIPTSDLARAYAELCADPFYATMTPSLSAVIKRLAAQSRNGHTPTTTTPTNAELDALAADTKRRMLAGEI